MVLEMDASTEFLLYAGVYRLTVLAIGALSIFLGYRLFSQSSAHRSSITASGGGFKLILNDLLPGTYFALFGTIIISIMVWQGMPQLTMNDNGIVAIRGGGLPVDDQTDIDQQWEKLDKLKQPLSEAAEPFSNIARIWQQEKRFGEAVAMARLASTYTTQHKAEYLALFADLLFENGEKGKAITAMQDAVKYDQKYMPQLLEMRNR